LTSCKPVSFSRRTLHHGVGKYVDAKSLTGEEKQRLLSSMGCGREHFDFVCRTERNPHIPYSIELRPVW